MKIRFTVSVAFGGKRYNSGDTATLGDSDAKHFVGMGYAEVVGRAGGKQQATNRAPRKAAARKTANKQSSKPNEQGTK